MFCLSTSATCRPPRRRNYYRGVTPGALTRSHHRPKKLRRGRTEASRFEPFRVACDKLSGRQFRILKWQLLSGALQTARPQKRTAPALDSGIIVICGIGLLLSVVPTQFGLVSSARRPQLLKCQRAPVSQFAGLLTCALALKPAGEGVRRVLSLHSRCELRGPLEATVTGSP
jgi:hypothetical protein